MHIAGFDLNLLTVLQALLEAKNVTVAARQLGLSQSATSHALARLRVALEDPLLVRGAHGLVLTARAESIAASLAPALASVQRSIAAPNSFDPARATRSFSLTTADYAEFLLLPPLANAFQGLSPGLSLLSRPYDREPWAWLESGDVDVAIGPVRPRQAMASFHAQALWSESFSCIVRADHPVLTRPWTTERFAEMTHAFIAPGGKPGGVVDDALTKLGLVRNIGLMLPHFLAAPFVIASSDLILTLPTRLATRFAELVPLAILAPPLQLPGFQMTLFWHTRMQHDESHKWFRTQILRAAASIQAAVPEGTRAISAANVGRHRRAAPASDTAAGQGSAAKRRGTKKSADVGAVRARATSARSVRSGSDT